MSYGTMSLMEFLPREHFSGEGPRTVAFSKNARTQIGLPALEPRYEESPVFSESLLDILRENPELQEHVHRFLKNNGDLR